MIDSAAALIRHVEDTGGKLTIDGPDIRFRPGDPRSADELEQALRAHKPEILALLRLRDDPLPVEWLTARCVLRDGESEETSELLIDLATWKAMLGLSTFTSRAAFESALRAEGFRVRDGRVYGLHLAPQLVECAP
jgi:hypothetical protein